MKDYYQILEISSDVSFEKIKEQYRLMTYAWHPDRFPNKEQKAIAEEKLKEINEAYEVLSNPKRRVIYDRERLSSFGNSGTERKDNNWNNSEDRDHANEPRENESDETSVSQQEEGLKRDYEDKEKGQPKEYPSFLDAAQNEKHTPWRYIAGTLLILFIWLGIGSVVSAVMIVFFIVLGDLNLQDLTQLPLDLSAIGMIPYYLVLSASFIIFFLGIWLTVVLVHGRSLRTLVTGAPRVNWRRIWLGGGIWVLLAVAASLVEYLIWPETFTLRFDWRVFLPFLLLAIFLTPIQTTSEELLFRGYLVQGGSLISRNAIFLSLWSGILFTIPHLANPEVAANLVLVSLTYFVLGAFLAWISIKDGTLELALGVHAGNNLFAALAVTFPDSALPTPAIFYTTHFDPLFSLLVQVLACILFYLAVFGWRKRPITVVETPSFTD